MSWFSRFTERIRRIFRRQQREIPLEQIIPTEIQVTPPIPEVAKEVPISAPEEIREIELPEEYTREEVAEKPELLSKIVIFEERIRGTRIKRTMERVYPIETNDGEIHRILGSQYDNGGNYVINIKTIDVKATPPFEEEEIDRGMPGSADVSP